MAPTSLIRPNRLRSGARVAVVAPAGPVATDQLEAGVQILRSWGLEVVVGERVLDRHPSLDYLAAADTRRAMDLQQAWLDPGIVAVFCARGGYGSLRIVEHLDWKALVAVSPKVFVGSSDVTALHTGVTARLGLVSLFAPMVATGAFVDDPAAQEHLRRTLFEPESTQQLSGPKAETLVGGTTRGTLVGGNLSLLAASVGAGARLAPPPEAIALLEDVGEEPYRIDRYLTQLLRAGWFGHIAGIALGSWTDCGDPETVQAVVVDRLAPLGVPLVWGIGFGHCPAALTVPLGATAELDADTATLTLTAPALR